MKKNVLVIILVLVLAALSVSETVNSVVEKNNSEVKYSYSVDQYRLPDGCIITIDWNQQEATEYKNVTYYKGCINNNGYIQFWFTDATTWYTWVYQHLDDGENHEMYLTTLTEWRW